MKSWILVKYITLNYFRINSIEYLSKNLVFLSMIYQQQEIKIDKRSFRFQELSLSS